MRKFLLAALMLVSTTSFSQNVAFNPPSVDMSDANTEATVSHKEPTRDPYVSPSVGWSVNGDVTYSFEAGCWARTNPVSYAFTFDQTKNTEPEASTKYAQWLGIKAYFNLKESANVTYYLSLASKFKMDGVHDNLIEIAFNPCYTLNKHWIGSVAVGSQGMKNSPWNWFMSCGFIYLLKK